MATGGPSSPTKGLLPQLDHFITSVNDVSPDLSQYKKMRHRIRFPNPVRKYAVESVEPEQERSSEGIEISGLSLESEEELNAADLKKNKMQKTDRSGRGEGSSDERIFLPIGGSRREKTKSREDTSERKKKRLEKLEKSPTRLRKARSSLEPNQSAENLEAPSHAPHRAQYERHALRRPAKTPSELEEKRRRDREQYFNYLAHPVKKVAMTVDQLAAAQEKARDQDISSIQRKIAELESLYNDLKHEVEAKESQLRKQELELQFLRTTDKCREEDTAFADRKTADIVYRLDETHDRTQDAEEYSFMLRHMRNRLKKENRELEALVKHLQKIERQQNIELNDATISLGDFRQAQLQTEKELHILRENFERERTRQQQLLEQQREEVAKLRLFREDLDERHRQRQKLLRDPEIRKERKMILKHAQLTRQKSAAVVGAASFRKLPPSSNIEAAYHKLLKLCSASNGDDIIQSIRERDVAFQRMTMEAGALKCQNEQKRINELEEERGVLTSEKGENSGMSNSAIMNIRNKKIDELNGALTRMNLKMKDVQRHSQVADKLLHTCHDFLHQMIERVQTAVGIAEPLAGKTGEGDRGRVGEGDRAGERAGDRLGGLLVLPSKATAGTGQSNAVSAAHEREKATGAIGGRGRVSPSIGGGDEDEEEEDEGASDAAVVVLENKLLKVLDMLPSDGEAFLPSGDLQLFDAAYYGDGKGGMAKERLTAMHMKSSFRYTIGAPLAPRSLDINTREGPERNGTSTIEKKPPRQPLYSVEAIRKEASEKHALRRPSVAVSSTSTVSFTDNGSADGDDDFNDASLRDVMAMRHDVKAASEEVIRREMKKKKSSSKAKGRR